ncbi:MAG: hypothetical protein J5611_01740 [Alphaproteobacteria bacterium]|nr:hypothetical protein [Alphaproteobacteria bacterium]
MSDWLGLTPKQIREKKATKLACAETDRHDAQIIEDIFLSKTAGGNVDVSIVLDLIMSPSKLIGLLEIESANAKQNKGTKHQLKCLYALHAILLALGDQDCADVLNQMSDNEIAELQECIALVKRHPCPNKALLNTYLQQRFAREQEKLSANDRLVNTAMIYTLQIALRVADSWDRAVANLHKWSDAIAAFEREPILIQQEPEVAQPTKEDFWTYGELAQKLGFPSVKVLQIKKQHFIQRCKDTTLVDKVKSWFICQNGGTPWLFKAEHFEELRGLLVKKPNIDLSHYDPNMLWTYTELAQKLGFPSVKFLQSKKHHFIERCKDAALLNEFKSWFLVPDGKPGLFKKEHFEELRALFAKRTKTNSDKATAQADSSAVAIAKPAQIKSVNGLVDVIAFEKYLLCLKQLWQDAQQELKTVEAEYDNTMAKLTKTKVAKRGALLQQAMQLNDVIAQRQETVGRAAKRFETAKSLWDCRQRAMETMRATDAEIAKLLAEFNRQK